LTYNDKEGCKHCGVEKALILLLQNKLFNVSIFNLPSQRAENA